MKLCSLVSHGAAAFRGGLNPKGELMSSASRDTEVANLKKREKALRRIYGNKSIVLEGEQFTGASLAERCAKQVAADEAVEEANRAWRDAVARRDAMRGENAAMFQLLQRLIQATYGKDSQMLGEFGYKPVEKVEKSAESKAAAVLKLRATRAARHTMGKRQKDGIHGTPAPSPVPRAV